MSGEDPFEIARRLDQHGAGKRARSPKPEEPVIKKAPAFTKKKSRPWGFILLLFFVVGATGWFAFLQGGEGLLGIFKPQPDRKLGGSASQTVPLKADPPKTIPSIHGSGEVPAFTVQIPATNAPPEPSPSAYPPR